MSGLQANYILVLGGQLLVGSEDIPFPSTAVITLSGGPDSPVRSSPIAGGGTEFSPVLVT